ncbi:TetR/AcrR family transcriptional regulator [Kitasatospora sp. NPDC054768]
MAEDRRTRRTRRALRDALVELALERGYAGLTVEDITERADVARATFYSHYRDKDDLLTRITADLLQELDERLHPLAEETQTGFTGKPLTELFRHARQERGLYLVILRGEGDGKALRAFHDESARRVGEVFSARTRHSGVTPRLPADLLARAWVGEQLAVLHWWLEQDPAPMPAEEAGRMLLDLAVHGRLWASGYGSPS